MTRDLPFRQRVLIGVITLTLMAGIVTVGLKYSTGAFASVYTVDAIFGHTGHGLDNFSTVKIRGVNVGKVSSIKVLPDGQADVALRIQRGVHIPDTTVASAEPLSIFGPLYVKLEPGAHEGTGPFLSNKGRISEAHSPVEITDILNRVSPVLTAVDPQDLLTVMHTFAAGIDGLGPQIGQLFDSSSKLVDLLNRQSANAKQFFVDLATLSNALGNKGPAMVSAAQDLNSLLPVISSRPDQIGQVLDAASRISVDLADLINGHSPAFDKTIAGMLTVVRAIYQQLSNVPSFLQALNGFFSQLGSGLLRLKGPNGHIIGVLEGQEPANLCLVLGLSGLGGKC